MLEKCFSNYHTKESVEEFAKTILEITPRDFAVDSTDPGETSSLYLYKFTEITDAAGPKCTFSVSTSK